MNRRSVVWLLLCACASAPSVTTTSAPVVGFIATVDSIADGDSFRADVFEVRLSGVNAPEQDECFGAESRDWLANEIEGEQIQFEIVGVDQFDRSIADVFHDGRFINLDLVRSGHALALSASQPEIQEAENDARENKQGLWGTEICGADGPLARLVITDVVYNPDGSDDQEIIVITNASAEPIELRGFQIRDESSVNRFTFSAQEIANGASVTVTSGCSQAPDNRLTWCNDGPVWNNDGDTALLLDPFGRIVSRYRYP